KCFESRACAQRSFGHPRARLLRAGRIGWSRRLGRVECRQLVRGCPGHLDQAGPLAEPATRRANFPMELLRRHAVIALKRMGSFPCRKDRKSTRKKNVSGLCARKIRL